MVRPITAVITSQTSASSTAGLLHSIQCMMWTNTHCIYRTDTRWLPSGVLRTKYMIQQKSEVATSFNGHVAKVN